MNLLSSHSIVYFQAAERHLARETGPASLITVQALLLSCFYTVTCTRLSHCWNLFGTTSRLILALGLHRRSAKFSGYQKKAVNCIRSECEKRVFWSAYILDKLLSAIHGRPSAFHDEDIDQVRLRSDSGARHSKFLRPFTIAGLSDLGGRPTYNSKSN